MFDYNFEGIFTLLKILFVIYILNYYYKYFTRPNPLPGPIPLPFIGSNIQIIYKLLKAGRYQFDLGEYAKIQAEEYGELSEMYQGSKRLIFLNKSEHLEKVYLAITNTKYFARPVFDGIKEFDVEHGLFFNANHESWKRIRKYVSQSLMSPRFLRGITITIQRLFEENEYRWNSYNDERIINLSDWIRYFSVDLNKEVLTGQKGYCLASFNLKESKWTNEMREARESIISIELYFRSLTFFTAVPKFVRLHFPIFSSYHHSFMKSLTSFQNKALCRIKERREQISKNVGVHLMDILLTAGTPRDPNVGKNHNTERPLTDNEIRDNILDLTIAGSDTTSNLFSLIFWNILTHPEVKARLLEEIETFFGQNSTDRKITFEDLEKFKYLDAMIKESMRLRPILPINSRVLSSAADTVAGYRWDPNTIFLINNLSIHRQKDHWREPEKFLPDRFLTDQITKNSYNPFGGGVRICPGRLMAMVAIKLLIISFFRKYNIELADKAKPMKHAFAGIYLYSNLLIKLSSKHQRN